MKKATGGRETIRLAESALIYIEPMLPDVVGHRRRHQGVYGAALLQVLAHIGGRDMIDMELYRAAVDAWAIGEQEGIVRQCEGAIAVADDELKGGEHLPQGGLCVVVVPG